MELKVRLAILPFEYRGENCWGVVATPSKN